MALKDAVLLILGTRAFSINAQISLTASKASRKPAITVTCKKDTFP